jgi:hypothetical protein
MPKQTALQLSRFCSTSGLSTFHLKVQHITNLLNLYYAGRLAEQANGPPPGMLPAVLAIDAESVEELLSVAGYRKGTWDQLQDLNTGCAKGDKAQLAAALYVKCISTTDCYEEASRACELYVQELGTDHPRSLACLHALADQLHWQHK